jgi:hypothetical protein
MILPHQGVTCPVKVGDAVIRFKRARSDDGIKTGLASLGGRLYAGYGQREAKPTYRSRGSESPPQFRVFRLIYAEGARFLFALYMFWVTTGSASAQPSVPRPEDYRVTEIFNDRPSAPVLTTSEQRAYRNRIREGVTKGRGVWTGSWKDPKKEQGSNFAGHYFVIRWGCGSNCLMMAVVDAKTGTVYPPPLSGVGTELYVPMDPMSDGEIDFRINSTLMVLRNACKEARKECGVYYFDWKNDHFALVSRALVDLTKLAQ